MRQKIISLSLDTYELASKKANFSAWVRRKLLEEVEWTRENSSKWHYCAVCLAEFPSYRESLACRCLWTAKTEVVE